MVRNWEDLSTLPSTQGALKGMEGEERSLQGQQQIETRGWKLPPGSSWSRGATDLTVLVTDAPAPSRPSAQISHPPVLQSDL